MFKFVLDNTPVVRVCIEYIEPSYAKMSIDPRDWICVPEEHKSTLTHEFQQWLKENDYIVDYKASICDIEYSAIPTYVIYQHDYSYWEEEIV
jgi:hypothetical protein